MGKPILLHLTLKNCRSESVDFYHTGDDSDFYLHLINREGTAVPETEEGRVWLASSFYEQLSNVGMTLRASESVDRDCDLNKYFVISQPGPYRLAVVKTVRGTASYPHSGRELEVDIDSLVFNVSRE